MVVIISGDVQCCLLSKILLTGQSPVGLPTNCLIFLPHRGPRGAYVFYLVTESVTDQIKFPQLHILFLIQFLFHFVNYCHQLRPNQVTSVMRSGSQTKPGHSCWVSVYVPACFSQDFCGTSAEYESDAHLCRVARPLKPGSSRPPATGPHLPWSCGRGSSLQLHQAPVTVPPHLYYFLKLILWGDNVVLGHCCALIHPLFAES